MKKIYTEKYKRLGIQIACYRKSAGLTQEQLAEKIGKNAAFIGHVEAPNIDKAISMDTLFDISEALNVPTYAFFLDYKLKESILRDIASTF